MRILVVGAGAVGGYFGGRLLEAGGDVTFLLRPRRAAELRRTGLIIRSPAGDLHLAAPPMVSAETLREPFDLILLSCKAYDLDDAIESFAPAVGPRTAILPLLNGMRHLVRLRDRFGAGRVLGGLVQVSTTLDPEGRILDLYELHRLIFGELDGSRSARAEAIAASFAGAGFESVLSEAIRQDMWEKWVFVGVGAALTCLMRGSIDDLLAVGGTDLILRFLAEAEAIAARAGFPPRDAALALMRTVLTTPGSGLKASMLRDIERGRRTEADHILGDLLRHAAPVEAGRSLLAVAYTHLRTYEAQRKRTQALESKAA
jgi:2-dehydropantoate 2-reductase